MISKDVPLKVVSPVAAEISSDDSASTDEGIHTFD